MTVYYNENDPFAAQWLRGLIRRGLLPPGDVDTRSIEDVRGSDLVDYAQAHFFAGIGGWPLALRMAGWPDDKPVWTGSCPCQPFSAAGRGGGFDDPRHLWPTWFRLIEECRPPVLFGEQVASPAGLAWFDLVHADLEGADYAVGAADLCAASINAPHIRQRLWWVADAAGAGYVGRRSGEASDGRDAPRIEPERFCDARELGDAIGPRLEVEHRQRRYDGSQQPAAERAGTELGGVGQPDSDGRVPGRPATEAPRHGGTAVATGSDGGVADAYGGDTSAEGIQRGGQYGQQSQDRCANPWSDVEWLPCRDGKWRPTESSFFRMVDGIPCGLEQLCFVSEEKKINGSTSDTLCHERVLGLWGTHEPEVNWDTPRRSDCIQESNLLRSSLHGTSLRGTDQSAQRPEQPTSVCEVSSERVRGMRQEHNEAIRPSQGRDPDEQHFVKLEDLVRFVSSAASLSELRLGNRTAATLQALRQTIYKAGSVRNAPESIEEAWRSLSQESKVRIGLGFNPRAWQSIPARNPLSHGASNRVGLLRGYGNAIVPPLAAEFIRAFMEIAS